MTKGSPNTEVSKINEILGDFIKKQTNKQGQEWQETYRKWLSVFFEMLIFAFILIFFLGEWHEQTKTKMYYIFLSGHSVL